MADQIKVDIQALEAAKHELRGLQLEIKHIAKRAQTAIDDILEAVDKGERGEKDEQTS